MKTWPYGCRLTAFVRYRYWIAVMALPLLLPLVFTAAAAVTAGILGARWLRRLQQHAARLDGDGSAKADGATPEASARSRAQTLVWCERCRSYVLPEQAAEGCETPLCDRRRPPDH